MKRKIQTLFRNFDPEDIDETLAAEQRAAAREIKQVRALRQERERERKRRKKERDSG